MSTFDNRFLSSVAEMATEQELQSVDNMASSASIGANTANWKATQALGVANNATQLANKGRQVHYYKSAVFNGALSGIVDINNWKNNQIFTSSASNHHFLKQPENYLKCYWRISYRNQENPIEFDIGPFLDVAEASAGLNNTLTGVDYLNKLTITPWCYESSEIPVLKTGFGYNNTMYRIFKRNLISNHYASKSFSYNSVATAAPFEQNTQLLRTIFNNVHGFDPFPVDSIDWSTQHYGCFIKNFKKKNKTKFLPKGRDCTFIPSSEPRHFYDTDWVDFLNISGQLSFMVNETYRINPDGSLQNGLLQGYKKSNVLSDTVYALRLTNGNRYMVMLKDYNKNRLCVSGFPFSLDNLTSLYELEAVVNDNSAHQKLYKLENSTSTYSRFSMAQFELSHIHLPPIPGSTVKFRLRNKETNEVGQFAKFMLKVIKQGPICVVDTVTIEE